MVVVATAGESGAADLVVAAEAGRLIAVSMLTLKAAAPIRARIRWAFFRACGSCGGVDLLDVMLCSVLFPGKHAQLCSYAWELGIPVPLRWCDVGGQLAAVLLACDHYVF